MSGAVLGRLLVSAMAFFWAATASGQEATGRFSGSEPPDVTLRVRSTTDIAIFAPTLEAFVKTYPKIRIEYEQWGSNALYDVTLKECKNATPAADVVISSGVHQMVDLVNRACASPYRSELTAQLPAARKWRDEIWGITREAAVIIYNKALVPPADAPRNRFALLDLMRNPDSRYVGKIATYDIEASGLGFLFAFMDSQEATTFGGLLEGFSYVDAIATCCSANIIERVENGQYLIAYNVLGSYVDSVPHQNIGVIYPEDYTLFLSRGFIIPKAADNVGSAAVLLDFLLSAEGQRNLAKSNLIHSRNNDDHPTTESSERYISINPTLLIAMDQHRKAQFVGKWRSTFGPQTPR